MNKELLVTRLRIAVALRKRTLRQTLTNEETALLLGKHRDTVRNIASRAIGKLRIALEAAA